MGREPPPDTSTTRFVARPALVEQPATPRLTKALDDHVYSLEPG